MLAAVQQGRRTKSRWGVGLASSYLRRMDGDQFGMSPEEWQRTVKEAEQRLTYCDPGMTIRRSKSPRNGESDGAILVFEATVSSKRKDRDGDILDPAGAVIDPNAALLWQHVHSLPIGRYFKTVKQNSRRIAGRFGIADLALGHDAATLVEFKALRISHGFDPLEWEEMLDKDDEFIGWHVKEYEIMEVSLVSVPSNTDAVVSAWERVGDKLRHPAVKSWVKRTYDERPTIVRGIELPQPTGKLNEEKAQDDTYRTIGYASHGNANTDTAWDEGAARRGMEVDDLKKYAAVVVKGEEDSKGGYKLLHHQTDGKAVYRACVAVVQVLNGGRGGMRPAPSDAVRKAVYAHVARHIRDMDKEPPELKEYHEGTMTNVAVWTAALDKYQKGTVSDGVIWTLDGPTWEIKTGRALSKANEDRIRDARDNCHDIAEMQDVPRAGKALAREARTRLDEVLKSVATDEGDEEDKRVKPGEVLAHLADGATEQELQDARALIEARLRQGRNAELRAGWRRLLG